MGGTKREIKLYHERVANASEAMEEFLTEKHEANKEVANLEIAATAFDGIGEFSSGITDVADDLGAFATKVKGKKSNNAYTKLIGVGAKIIGLGLNIAAMAKKVQLAQEGYDKQIKEIQALKNHTEKYKKAFEKQLKLHKVIQTFQMTKSTQKAVLLALEDLGQKVDDAINETTKVQAIWNKVTKGIENMKDNAEVARNKVVDEDAETGIDQPIAISETIEQGKKYLFVALRQMFHHWKNMVYKPLPGLCTIFGCQSDYISLTPEELWNVSEPEKLVDALVKEMDDNILEDEDLEVGDNILEDEVLEIDDNILEDEDLEIGQKEVSNSDSLP
jgi:hypothetical protein